MSVNDFFDVEDEAPSKKKGTKVIIFI